MALVGKSAVAVEGAKPKAKVVDVQIDRVGTRMVLPEKMTLKDAIASLTRKLEEEQTPVRIHEEVEAFPLDGAHALTHVLREMFGWAQAVPTEGFFGPNPPTIVTLETDFEEKSQVLWGSFTVPGVNGTIQTGAGGKDGRLIFVISGTVTKESQPIVQEIADRTRQFVKLFSVYRGKAIRLTTSDNGSLNANSAPKFLDLRRVNPDELTFSAEVAEQIQTSLWTPIQKTAMCRQHRIPLKRGVLLEGPYGCGKTLTAYVTAKNCVANGWTFIYLDRVSGLKAAMEFARQYGPSVIFAEDIDRVLDGERDTSVDDILNTIDGIESKGSELIVILTTNHVERIERAMLRPGRLDAVISVSPPDAAAAQKLIRIYARDLVDAGEDLTAAGEELGGQIPAVIREVVERSKLYAMGRLKDGEQLHLKSSDLVASARGMKHHLGLMAPAKAKVQSDEERVGDAIGSLFQTRLAGGLVKLEEKFGEIVSNMN